MNKLMLIVGVFVAVVYFGGSNVPKVLRDNKKMLCGVLVGVVLSVLIGPTLEGYHEVGHTDSTGGQIGDGGGSQRIMQALRGGSQGKLINTIQHMGVDVTARDQQAGNP